MADESAEEEPKPPSHTEDGRRREQGSTGDVQHPKIDSDAPTEVAVAVDNDGTTVSVEGESVVGTCPDAGDSNETASSTRAAGGEGAECSEKSRPPRPPGSINQARRDKRRAGWAAKKALVKEAKREKREHK